MGLLDEFKKYFALKGETLGKTEIVDLVGEMSGQPKALSINDPVPTEEGVYLPEEVGAYPNGLTKREGYDTKFVLGGGVWKVVETPLLKVETIDNLNTPDTDKALSSNQGVVIKPRILPSGNQFSEVDRPDIAGDEFVLLVTDEEGKVVAELRDTKIIPEKTVDRPDIQGVVYIDFNGNILAMGGSSAPAPPPVGSAFNPVFYNPQDQPAFYLNAAPYDTVANFMAAIDAAVGYSNWSPSFPSYVTKTLLGKSTRGNFDIYEYEFKPPTPTVKLVVTNCIHGIEKFTAAAVLRFLHDLCQNWMEKPAFEWFRANVHLVLVPLANPYGFETLNRRVLETDPFPATWTKSGTTVTVTFNPVNFPNTNTNVSASDYFSRDGIAGKLWLSLINSSDQSACPDNGYLIQSVVNAQTVTITVPAGGASSGSCDIYISTDPNRGYDSVLKPWADTAPTGLNAYAEPVAVPLGNKGSRPYALNEIKIIKALFEKHSDADAHIDLHNGAGNYDTRISSELDQDVDYILRINELHAQFTNDEMPFRFTSLTSNTMSSESAKHGIHAKTIEWGGFDTAAALDIVVLVSNWRNGYRWITNTIINTAKHKQK